MLGAPILPVGDKGGNHHHLVPTEVMDINHLGCRQRRQGRIIQDPLDQDQDCHVDRWDPLSHLHQLDPQHLLACHHPLLQDNSRFCLYIRAYRRRLIQGDRSSRSRRSRKLTRLMAGTAS